MPRDLRGQTAAGRLGYPTSTATVPGKADVSRLARVRARARREDGQAMVEFALVLPVLMLFIVGIIKVGIVYNNYLTLNDAVRAGARQLAIGRGQASDVCSLATTRVRTAASNLDQSKIQALTASVNTGNCNPGTSMVIGSDATVSANYPCDVNVLFINIAVTCHAQTTERVE
jgi:Flp pilus assembly protein TadG